MSRLVAMKQIGKCVTPADTWNPTRSAPNHVLKYIDLSSVDNQAKCIISCQNLLGREAPSRARQLVRAGDILVSTVRPNLNGVARVPAELNAATASTGFCVLRTDGSKLDVNYLFHWLTAPDFINDMVRKATGASYPAVSDRIIFESEIPLPSFLDQQRIAAILDQADNLRRKRRQSIVQINRILDAVFEEVCSLDVARIAIEVALREGVLLVHKDGNRGSLYPRAEEFGTSGIPFISAKSISSSGNIDDLHTERLSESKANMLRHGWIEHGDILLAHSATVGKVGFCKGEYDRAIVGTSLTVFRCNKERLFPEFLFSALRSDAFQTQLTRIWARRQEIRFQ